MRLHSVWRFERQLRANNTHAQDEIKEVVKHAVSLFSGQKFQIVFNHLCAKRQAYFRDGGHIYSILQTVKEDCVRGFRFQTGIFYITNLVWRCMHRASYCNVYISRPTRCTNSYNVSLLIIKCSTCFGHFSPSSGVTFWSCISQLV